MAQTLPSSELLGSRNPLDFEWEKERSPAQTVPGSFPGLAKAQLYPTKPVKIILPIPAGSPMDALGRIIANQLAQAVRYRQSTGRGTVFGGSRRGDGKTPMATRYC